MKPARLEQLADGIFAIVMTLLIFDLKVPALISSSSAPELMFYMKALLPSLLTYVLSFALIFTYWRAHHFFVSVYAKNIDRNLTNINAVFFFLITMLPFTTSLLGHYTDNELAIIIFGLHTFLIGACLFWIRYYVFKSPHIKNIEVSSGEIHRGTIRIFVPMVCSLLAILISFADISLSIWLFTIAVIFNFSHTSTTLINKFFKSI